MKNADQHFLLDTPSGKLEVCLEKPDASETLINVGLVCHPHPQHGGTMDNKVVTTVAKAFRELNMISVRFNYRGVGKSEGTYDEAIGETQDALNILEWIHNTLSPQNIVLAGFSFGAYVSLKAAIQTSQKLAHLISIAPAVTHSDFTNLIPPCPWTVLIAENDTVAPAQDIHAWIDTLIHKPAILSFPEASHFFDGQLISLKTQIKNIPFLFL